MEGVKLKEHEHLSADEPHAASAHLLKHWYIIQCLHNSAQSSSSCDGVKERSLWTPEIIRFELQNPTKKKKGGKSLSMIINIIKWPEAEQNCITKLTSEHPYLPATPTHPAVPPPPATVLHKNFKEHVGSCSPELQPPAEPRDGYTGRGLMMKNRVWSSGDFHH